LAQVVFEDSSQGVVVMMLRTRNGLKKLEQKRRDNITEATKELLENDDVDAADKALHKVKLSQELQTQYTLLSKKRFISPLFILLCLLIFSFLWFFHHPNPRIHLDLEVETAVFRLAERRDFTWQKSSGLKTERFFVDGHFIVDAPGLGLDGSGERLSVEGVNVSLTQFTISKGARLEIERSKDGISLYIYEGLAQGLLEIQDGSLRLQGDGTPAVLSVQLPVPETLRFSTGNHSEHRLHLRLQTDDDWQLYGLQVTDMRFQQEMPPDSNNFISSIRKGTIELPEIKRKEKLLGHDWLHMKKISSTRLVLDFPSKGAEYFDLIFQGRAASIEVGPDDFEQDLTPSLLTWIYHQKQLFFYWGSLVFIYGLLTNLRTLLARR
jgi:hypothetical protein